MKIDLKRNRQTRLYREGGFLDMFKQFLSKGKDYFGSKPDVPNYPTAPEILENTINTNQGALPGATKLAGGINTANQGILSGMFESLAPSWLKTLSNIGKNNEAATRGEVPKDVEDALARSSAGKALTGGYSGSGMGANLSARDLGLTSLDLTRRGQTDTQNFGSFLRGTAMPNLVGVESMQLKPEQVQNIMEQKWNEQYLRAKIEGMPDPVARGRADQEMALFATIMSAVGGMMGGGGGGSQPQQYQPPNYGGPTATGGIRPSAADNPWTQQYNQPPQYFDTPYNTGAPATFMQARVDPYAGMYSPQFGYG